MANEVYKIEKYLKDNIPEFQSGSPYLDAYLEAAGTFLDEIKNRIEDFDYIKDYDLIGFGGLNNNLHERGNDLPRALPTPFRREWLRDIADHKAKFGTDSAIRHALSSVGIVGDVRGTWLLSPELLKDGQARNPETGEIVDIPDGGVGGKFRTNLLFGEPVVTENGTKVEGYDYFDFDKERPKHYYIQGEKYDSPINKTVNFVAAKTPYIVVTFFREDFNINTGNYVDPITGEEYQYTAEEEAVLMDEIIRFFSLGENRPTTIKIIMVVIDRFSDDFLVTDDVWEENFIALSKFYPMYAEDDAVFSETTPVGVGGHWEDEPLNLVEDDTTTMTMEPQEVDEELVSSEDLFEENFIALSKSYNLKAETDDVNAEDQIVVVGGHWEDEPLNLAEGDATTMTMESQEVDEEIVSSEDLFEDNFISLTKSYNLKVETDDVSAEDQIVVIGGHWEGEPLNVVSNLTPVVSFTPEYPDLIGKPGSTSVMVDEAVGKKHSHDGGISVLDGIEEIGGTLGFRGRTLGLHLRIKEW